MKVRVCAHDDRKNPTRILEYNGLLSPILLIIIDNTWKTKILFRKHVACSYSYFTCQLQQVDYELLVIYLILANVQLLIANTVLFLSNKRNNWYIKKNILILYVWVHLMVYIADEPRVGEEKEYFNYKQDAIEIAWNIDEPTYKKSTYHILTTDTPRMRKALNQYFLQHSVWIFILCVSIF